jgi:hypothetical protein
MLVQDLGLYSDEKELYSTIKCGRKKINGKHIRSTFVAQTR